MEVKLKDTLNTAWKNDKTGFGFRMLQKMGWSENKGLGKNESGITDNIKLSKREDGLGLGMEKNSDGAGNKGWSQTASSFNDVLAMLKESYGKTPKKKKSKSVTDVAPISVGIKYKKHSEAKKLSTKSTDDMRAILGAAASKPVQESDLSDSEEGEIKKSKKSKKDKKSKKKRKREAEGDDSEDHSD